MSFSLFLSFFSVFRSDCIELDSLLKVFLLKGDYKQTDRHFDNILMVFRCCLSEAEGGCLSRFIVKKFLKKKLTLIFMPNDKVVCLVVQ